MNKMINKLKKRKQKWVKDNSSTSDNGDHGVIYLELLDQYQGAYVTKKRRLVKQN